MAIPNPYSRWLDFVREPARWDPLKARGRSGMADDDLIENPEPLALAREECGEVGGWAS